MKWTKKMLCDARVRILKVSSTLETLERYSDQEEILQRVLKEYKRILAIHDYLLARNEKIRIAG